jgi:hypothetical protein
MAKIKGKAKRVKPGDVWEVDGRYWHAQLGSTGILLREVLVPESLKGRKAVLVSRSK